MNQNRSALSALTDEKIRDLNWYYAVELRPGVVTKGKHFANALATLKLIDRIDLRGLRVLDVGAMEGYFSVLTERAGATVTSYDRRDRMSAINLVKEANGAQFPYFYGMPFNRFVADHHALKSPLFDAIVFSGVLYHTIEPMLFLYLVRTMLRPGGILIMETSSVLDEECLLVANDHGRFTPSDTYYHPTTGWIDYTLRCLGFQIVDVEHVHIRNVHGRNITRCATTCVLGPEEGLREPTDKWTGRPIVLDELAEYQTIRCGIPETDGRSRIRPNTYAEALYYPTARKALRLTETIRSTPATLSGEVVLRLRKSG